MTAAITHRAHGWRDELDVAGRALWHMPEPFRVARWLGPHYALRCVLFHHIADSESDFTRGLGITTPREDFESALKFLTTHYNPVRLNDVLNESGSHQLPPRPVLVTFDDSYASIREVAAPLCRKYDIPAVWFVNAACLDNGRLALDNLICFAANAIGMCEINAVANRISAPRHFVSGSMKDVFNRFLPALSSAERDLFRKDLIEALGISDGELSARARLYVTSAQLRELADFDFDVGNHTYTHVHCRSLTRADFEREIDRNKSELTALTQREVRSFSVPYGCSEDLPAELAAHLRHTGHEAAFLVESATNPPFPDRFRVQRVSVKGRTDAGFFSEIEILPRVRAIGKWLSGNRSRAREKRFA